jgi:hypothetical protein
MGLSKQNQLAIKPKVVYHHYLVVDLACFADECFAAVGCY